MLNWIVWNRTILAQSAEASDYTDYITAERQDSSNDFPGYDIKQSDGEATVTLDLWGVPVYCHLS